MTVLTVVTIERLSLHHGQPETGAVGRARAPGLVSGEISSPWHCGPRPGARLGIILLHLTELLAVAQAEPLRSPLRLAVAQAQAEPLRLAGPPAGAQGSGSQAGRGPPRRLPTSRSQSQVPEPAARRLGPGLGVHHWHDASDSESVTGSPSGSLTRTQGLSIMIMISFSPL
eukprot:1392510-Rhodomonas_salina.2